MASYEPSTDYLFHLEENQSKPIPFLPLHLTLSLPPPPHSHSSHPGFNQRSTVGEVYRAGRRVGIHTKSGSEYCVPLPMCPSPWGILLSYGCSLGQDSRFLTTNTV